MASSFWWEIGLTKLPLATDLPPTPENLSRRRGARRANLLDGDRADHVAKLRRFHQTGPSRISAGNPGANAIARAHRINGAGHRKSRNADRWFSRLSDDDAIFATGAKNRPGHPT